MRSDMQVPPPGSQPSPIIAHQPVSSDKTEASKEAAQRNPTENRVSKEFQQAVQPASTKAPEALKKSRIGEFFSSTADKIQSAVKKVFSFFKPASTEQKHDKAVSHGMKHGVEAGFKKDPSNKEWQKDPGVAAFKKELKTLCKEQISQEGHDLSDHSFDGINDWKDSKWTKIKADVEKGDFTSAQKALEDPDLKAKISNCDAKFNLCAAKREEAFNKFSVECKSQMPAVGSLGEKGEYSKETFLSPVGRVQVSDVGVLDLGCTKSSDDSDYTTKGKKYCQDRAAILAFPGGTAVCASDGVSSAKDSEDISQLATEKLNQKLSENAEVLRGLYEGKKPDKLEAFVKELFVEVQEEIYADLAKVQEEINADPAKKDLKAATTAVAFVKIDIPGKDYTLVIGGSIGDCGVAKTTIGKDGRPSVELLNPQCVEPSIRKSPPVFHYEPTDDQAGQLSKVRNNTHVFAVKVPKGALLETFSDGTADNLATTTPAQNAANAFLPGIIPPPGKWNSTYAMDVKKKTAFQNAIEELVGTTQAEKSPALMKDVKAALKSLEKDNPVLEDNQIVHKAFMSLFKRDMEQSLEAIYSNPHLDALTPDSKSTTEFNYGLARHEGIRQFQVEGHIPSGKGVTLEAMAQRKANLLHFLTEPLREVLGAMYRFENVLDRKTDERDGTGIFEGKRVYAIENTPENRKIISDLQKANQLIKKHTHAELDLTTTTEEGMILIPMSVNQLSSKNVEETLGVKVDDVCNAIIQA